MLIALLVSTVGIGVGKLRIAGLFNVAIVTDS